MTERAPVDQEALRATGRLVAERAPGSQEGADGKKDAKWPNGRGVVRRR